MSIDDKTNLADLANEILELESETFEISDYADASGVLLAVAASCSTSSTSTCSSTTSTTSCSA
ncbi:thiazolylpeptide-type bacteriocin [Micromonospora sp. NPDC003944]